MRRQKGAQLLAQFIDSASSMLTSCSLNIFSGYFERFYSQFLLHYLQHRQHQTKAQYPAGEYGEEDRPGSVRIQEGPLADSTGFGHYGDGVEDNYWLAFRSVHFVALFTSYSGYLNKLTAHEPCTALPCHYLFFRNPLSSVREV